MSTGSPTPRNDLFDSWAAGSRYSGPDKRAFAGLHAIERVSRRRSGAIAFIARATRMPWHWRPSRRSETSSWRGAARLRPLREGHSPWLGYSGGAHRGEGATRAVRASQTSRPRSAATSTRPLACGWFAPESLTQTHLSPRPKRRNLNSPHPTTPHLPHPHPTLTPSAARDDAFVLTRSFACPTSPGPPAPRSSRDVITW